MKNALTVDLEDYYHVSALADRIDPADWQRLTARLQFTTELVLELLEAAGCKATFFVLGWVAERYPELIRRIAEGGHELGCHSYRHRLVYTLTADEFREDTRQAKELIEDASGAAVRGYRAPSFSITPAALQAYEVLAELGFAYDSSVFPVEHPNYGFPGAPRSPFLVETSHGPIVEFPMPTIQFAGRCCPIAGGAYLRLLPYRYTRWAIRFLNHQEQRPVCVYFHPWELDPGQPRVSASMSARIRHYMGLGSMQSKLRSLLRDFQFCALGALVEEFQPMAKPFLSANGGTRA